MYKFALLYLLCDIISHSSKMLPLFLVTSSNRDFSYRGSPLAYTIACAGSEQELGHCRMYYKASCYYRNQIGIRCSSKRAKTGIHITTMEDGSVSILENIKLSNISGIQVSGTPPTVVNVTLEDTDFGFVFVGRGIALEKDINMSNVTVRKVRKLMYELCYRQH